MDTQRFFIEKERMLVPFEVEELRLHKNLWIAKLVTLENRDQAEALIKHRVLLEDTLLRPLEDNEVFLHELIGCHVEDLAGTKLGQVKDVIETGANDVYVVSGEHQDFMVPANPRIVKEIDVLHKVVRIDPIPGLIE